MIELNKSNQGLQGPSTVEDSGFDFMKFVAIVMAHWYWMLLSIVLCMGLALAYLYVKKPVYAAQMMVLISDKDNPRYRYSNMAVDMSKISGMTTNSEGFDNELEIIGSKSVAMRVVQTLKLYVSYSTKGRLLTYDLYKDSPVFVELEEERLELFDSVLHIAVVPDGKKIKVEGYSGNSEEKAFYRFSQTLESLPATVPTKFGQLLFTANPSVPLERRIDVRVVPLVAAANSFRARMSVAPSSKMTTVAAVRLTDINKARAIDYLNELVVSYNKAANEEKNEVARRSEDFINKRLAIIQGELDDAEQNLQDYKEDHSLINLKNDATQALASSMQYQEKQVSMQTEMTLLRALREYVENPNNAYKVIPANMGLSSNEANGMISQYNELVLKRQRLLVGSNEGQPIVVDLTMQIDNMRSAVRQMLQSQFDAMEIQKRTIDNQYARFRGQVSSTPGQERAINNITRQQEVKSGLYLMLLQKREENAISLAATAAKARIIDAPEFAGQIAPKRLIVLLLGLLFGIGLPVAVVYIRELFRFKIEGPADMAMLTTLPVLANLPMSKTLKNAKERAIVVNENTNNMMEEAFRGLRTNLKFVLKADQGQNVLMVTSVVPGEGKTFVSTNLAMSYALLGKRVIVVGLDVRKPRLANLFSLGDTKRGITNFLITDGKDTQMIEYQIFHGVGNANLDVLPAGVLPPNPGELIAQPSMGIAIEYLSKKYDVVILDTSPIGLVSDALDIAHLAHATVVVCRCEVSERSSVKWVEQITHEGKLPNANYVVNGITAGRKGYGYYAARYSHYGSYGSYGSYGNYGSYGTYGNYGDQTEKGKKSKK